MPRYNDWPLRVMNGKTGQNYMTLANPKLVIHTTETTGFPNYDWPPHITYHIDEDRGQRHVDGRLGAYALRSPGGGRSPNYQAGPVFQIEVVAFARESPTQPDWWYQRLARLIADVCTDWKIPLVFHPAGFTGSQAYGESGVNRISWENYRQFTGILGHQHVPYNTHWDPGALNIQRLSTAINQLEEDTDVALTAKEQAALSWLVRHIDSKPEDPPPWGLNFWSAYQDIWGSPPAPLDPVTHVQLGFVWRVLDNAIRKVARPDVDVDAVIDEIIERLQEQTP